MGNFLRLLGYPKSASSYHPDRNIRAGAHSDCDSVTLLFWWPGQPGLGILISDEKWTPVPVYPDCPFPPILVNIGDMLSYWTNKRLESTDNRVMFPNLITPM